MGAVPEEADGDSAARKANRRSASRRTFWIVGGLFAVAAAMAAIGGSWWLARDTGAVFLRVGTGPVGTDSYVLMREAAEVVRRHSDDLRLQAIATRDPSENISLLNSGRIDAAAIRADTPVVSDVRMVANLYSDYFHLIVNGDAPAFEIDDVPRLRIAIPQYGTDAFRSFWVIADHYDLPIERFDWTATDFATAREGLLDGGFDALFTVRSLRDRALLLLFEDAQLKSKRLRYLPIRQAEAISLKRPFLGARTIPAGALSGAGPVPARPTPTGTVERILVTREQVSADTIRQLTEILFEHRLDLTIRFALASAISAPNESAGLNIPLHDGAEQFYTRDEPGFLQENAEPIALMVTVFAMLVSALLALRSRLVASQKNRADRYNHQLLDLNARAAASASLPELAGMRSELNRILETVVIALDTDEVTDEGFQSFALLWESVRDTIRDRQSELARNGTQT